MLDKSITSFLHQVQIKGVNTGLAKRFVWDILRKTRTNLLANPIVFLKWTYSPVNCFPGTNDSISVFIVLATLRFYILEPDLYLITAQVNRFSK